MDAKVLLLRVSCATELCGTHGIVKKGDFLKCTPGQCREKYESVRKIESCSTGDLVVINSKGIVDWPLSLSM
jgi:hypothetical protein